MTSLELAELCPAANTCQLLLMPSWCSSVPADCWCFPGLAGLDGDKNHSYREAPPHSPTICRLKGDQPFGVTQAFLKIEVLRQVGNLSLQESHRVSCAALCFLPDTDDSL